MRKLIKAAALSLSIAMICTMGAVALPVHSEAAGTVRELHSIVLASINGWPVSSSGGGTYDRTAGMCIDRANRVAFVIKNTTDDKDVCLYSTSSTSLTSTAAGKSVSWNRIEEWHAGSEASTIMGHPNDVCAVPSGANTVLYIATDKADKGIVRLTVDNAHHRVVESPKVLHMYYKHNGKDTYRACGSIGYSVGGDKFVARRTGIDQDKNRVTCVVGNFSGSKLAWNKKFYLKLGTSIPVRNNGTVDLTVWSVQGMCFYDGKIYLTLSNTHQVNQAVIVGYKTGGLGGITKGEAFSPSVYFFDTITTDSSDMSKLENESADGYNGNIVFATNELGLRSDSIREYTSNQVEF